MRFAVRTVLGSVVLPVVAAWVLALGAKAQVPGQFLQPQVVKTGNWPVFVAAADVNGDGVQDLIYIDAGATPAASVTHVLLGDGHGGFSDPAKSTRLDTAGTSLAIGDLTGNGKVDIGWVGPAAPATGNGFFFIAAGAGNGTFAAPVNATGITMAQPSFVTALKLHDSGPLDIVVEDSASNTVYAVQYSAALGRIGMASSAALPDGPGPEFSADLNGDGHFDLIVDGQTGYEAQVFLGTGTGVVFPATASLRFHGLTGVHSLLVQDVDGDKIPDMIVEGVAGHIDVFSGKGDGTFQPVSEGGTGPQLDGTTGNGGHLIKLADLNGDQFFDAITTTPAGMSVLLGGGTQYYGLKDIYNVGPGHSSYAIADFNGDGFLDVAVDSPEGIAILYGNSDGSFKSSRAFAAGQPALSGAVGAFTPGGPIDAVVSTGATQAQVLRGDGHGVFAAFPTRVQPVPTTTDSGLHGLFGTVAVGDFDGDGKLDIAMTQDGSSRAGVGVAPPTTGSGLSIQYGKGDGTFGAVTPVTAAIPYLMPSTCRYLSSFPGPFFGTSAVGDFNGDGIDDIANLDVGSYRVMQGVAGSVPMAGFYAGDTDAGGYIDCDLDAHDYVISGNLSGGRSPDLIFQDEGGLEVFLNDGKGKFTYSGDLSRPSLLTTAGSTPAPSLDSTFGGLSPSDGFNFPAFLGSAVIADLDGDGNGDFIAAYDNLSADHTAPTPANPNYIYIWFGSGGGKFLTSAKHPVNPIRFSPSRNYYQLVVADMNGDGIPDLVMSDGYVLSVQYGNGDGTFQGEEHYLAGQGLNTISAADVNGDGNVDLVVANGGVVFGNPVANKEVLAVNPDVNTGGITVLLNGIKTRVVTGALTASPEPSGYGAAFTITAALTVPSGGAAATGTVTFSVDGTVVGTPVSVSGTSAVLSVPASLYATLVPGNHALTAAYSGDANYVAKGLTGTHAVSLAPTRVLLTPTTPLQLSYGQPADGTITIFVVDPGHPAMGTYTLQDNGVDVKACTNLPIAPPASSMCPYGNPILLDVGVHAFTIVYHGDAFNAPSNSPPVTYTVGQDTTSGLLITSLTQAAPGQAVVLTAKFTGTPALPVGPVMFLDGTTPLGQGMLLDSQGTAVLTTTTLPLGPHVITAYYAATLDFSAKTTNPVNVLIKQPPVPQVVQVNLVSSTNPSAPGQTVMFTASVTTPGPFITIPTGTVTFLDGTTVIGTGPLDQYGVATFMSSTLSSGSHPMTASFAGNAASGSGPPVGPPTPPVAPSGRGLRARTQTQGITPGVSPVLTQVVGNALPAAASGFTLTVFPTQFPIGVGRTQILNVTTLRLSGFADPIALSCSGLPIESTCTFSPSTVMAPLQSASLQVTTMAPHDCDAPGSPYFIGGNTGLPKGLMAAPVLAGLAMFFVPGAWRRRRWMKGLLTLLLMAGLAGLGGCGRCTDLGTKPGTYTFTVTATGGGITESQDVTMTVTIP